MNLCICGRILQLERQHPPFYPCHDGWHHFGWWPIHIAQKMKDIAKKYNITIRISEAFPWKNVKDIYGNYHNLYETWYTPYEHLENNSEKRNNFFKEINNLDNKIHHLFKETNENPQRSPQTKL